MMCVVLLMHVHVLWTSNYFARFLSCYAFYCYVKQLRDYLSYLAHNPLYLFCSPCLLSLYVCIHSVIIPSIVFHSLDFFCSSTCLNLILTPPPAAQNANANADFANFDAFGSTSGSTGGFPSAPQAPFHPSNTGRASSLHWTKSTSHTHEDISLYNYVNTRIENVYKDFPQTTYIHAADCQICFCEVTNFVVICVLTVVTHILCFPKPFHMSSVHSSVSNLKELTKWLHYIKFQ